MICPNCGTDIGNSRFCPFCGADMSKRAELKQQPQKVKKPIFKRWWFWVICAVLVIGIIGSMQGDKEPSNQIVVNQGNSTQQQIPEQDPEPATPSVPQEYLNALQKAQSYSDNMHMSKKGLYDQLTSEYGEGFPPEAAQYAIDNVDADFNENALAKAKSYYYNMSMSKDAVWDQLTSAYGEQFTHSEADYAIANLP